MADNSKIEWTDATWNIVTGCSVISAGCTNCYAMRLAGARLRHTQSRNGLTVGGKAGPVWNGKVRFNEQWLTQPLRWKNPRRIFVCAHGDLFHENVPDEWIDRVFAVMALCRNHIFQVLTKRPARMREYFAERWQGTSALPEFGIPAGKPTGRDYQVEQAMAELAETLGLTDPDIDDHWTPEGRSKVLETYKWPLPNVWLGVSVENQDAADARIPLLLATPAAVRFVSAEPLLGPVDITKFGELDWVIVGGESGPHARPMHPVWARSLRDQCVQYGVPFFMKQWGAWAPEPDEAGTYADYRRRARMELVGKKRAGRLLDGREWNEFPEPAR